MKLIILLIGCSLAAFAQFTTVADTIHTGNGDAVSGTIYITPNSQFTAGNGAVVYRVPVAVPIAADGSFTVDLYPNDTASPSGTSYSARYTLDGPPGASFQVPTETWVVPTSGSPVGLSSVRTSPAPSPSVSGYITSLNGLSSVTQLFARTNDTNVTLSITSAISTHTFALGWTGQLAASRGGTGAGALTTGSVPFIGASGVYSQDNSRLFWDNTNHRLGIGTATPSMSLDIVDGQAKFMTAVGYSGGKGGIQTTANDSRGGIQFLDSSASSVAEFVEDPTYDWRLSTAENKALNFGVNSTTAGGFSSGATTEPISELGNFVIRPGGAAYRLGFGYDTTDNYSWAQSTQNGVNYTLLHLQPQGGNVIIGGCAGLSDCTNKDGNYRFDVQSSGTSGTVRIYDQTPSTGESSLHIRLGPNQLNTGTAPFEIRRTDGTSQLMGVDNAGGIFTSNGTTRLFVMGVTANSLAANLPINWSNTNDDVDQTRDLGISRCAAGVLCVGNGTAANKAGRIALDNTTPSASTDACTAQSIWADASFVYVCTASGAIKRAAISTW